MRFDEALALPTEHSATLALRTQQLLAAEAGALDTADPLGGSYFIEALTDELEARAWELIERVDQLGGAVEAIEKGFVQEEIEQSAFAWQQAIESGERVIVGVNRFQEAETQRVELLKIDPEGERRQIERTAKVRAGRNAAAAERRSPPCGRQPRATKTSCRPCGRPSAPRTVGELCETLRAEWGMYDAVRTRA